MLNQLIEMAKEDEKKRIQVELMKYLSDKINTKIDSEELFNLVSKL